MRQLKCIFAAFVAFVIGVNVVDAQSPSFDSEQYQKALWMTTRFYGAQRSGDGPNWLIADYEPTDVANNLKSNLSAFIKGKSYVKDADGDYDLTGGWYDCGDFATFGQTFFYSAYMLLLGYSEFPAGFDDYYSTDYHGYVASGDYTWEGKKGVPDGIPDVLNEAKYATDFILKAVRSSSIFYYQKGNGDDDHKVWCTSPTKSTLSKSDGGEAGGSREISKATGNVTSMACLAGASLAVMAREYKKFDPAYAQQCLEKALVAYEFVTGTSKGNSVGATSFYGNKPKFVTDEVVFYAELYRTTGDSKYLKAAEGASSWMTASTTYDYNFSLCYNNTEDLACYLMASLGDATSYSSYAMTAMDYYINTMYKPTSGYFLNKKNDAWGVLRFPANQAFSYALYDKLKGVTTVNPYSLTSIEYIMGKNGAGFSYIVGFGNKHPFYPHHRNFYRSDNNDEGNLPNITSSYKYIQLGYLVGGSLNDGAYEDVEKSYTFSEGGIDYNAGLVCALGYINSMMNPVNVNKFGHPTPELGEDVSICGLNSVLLDSKVEALPGRDFTWYKDGTKLQQASGSTYTATSAGEYTCEVDSAGEWQTTGSVNVLAALPEVEWEEETELCNPSHLLLGLTMSANVSYQWFKDGTALSGETNATYEVTKAGTYKCEMSSVGCDKVTKSVEVTSLLPVVADVTSDMNGNVSMVVTSEGEYEWYDAETDGNLLHEGATYTTRITEDTKFYVQDAGAMDITVGPTSTTFTGTGVNWGNIGAKFSAAKAFSIMGLTVVVKDAYSSGNKTLTAELEDASGKKSSYTSDAQLVNEAGYKTFTFSTPIDVTAAGNYTLTCKGSDFSVAFFEKGPSYSTYAGAGNPITFTGATNGTADNNPFPGVTDWQIRTGSGCKRAVVNAKKGEGVGLCEEGRTSICALYPNPVENLLYVDLSCNASLSEIVTVDVISLVGTVEKSFELPVSELSKGLNLESLAGGIYMIRIKNGDKVAVGRVIKK